MSSWGCPHEANGVCQHVNKLPCDPGMRGCVLYGRFVFSNPAKNRPAKPDAPDTAEGKLPTGKGRGAWKEPSPLPSSTETVLL